MLQLIIRRWLGESLFDWRQAWALTQLGLIYVTMILPFGAAYILFGQVKAGRPWLWVGWAMLAACAGAWLIAEPVMRHRFLVIIGYYGAFALGVFALGCAFAVPKVVTRLLHNGGWRRPK